MWFGRGSDVVRMWVGGEGSGFQQDVGQKVSLKILHVFADFS